MILIKKSIKKEVLSSFVINYFGGIYLYCNDITYWLLNKCALISY